MNKKALILIFSLLSLSLLAQKAATVRGNIYDKANGQPIPFANVVLQTASDNQPQDKQTPLLGTSTDVNGFFQISNVQVGNHRLVVTFVGYDSVAVSISTTEGGIIYKSIYLSEVERSLETIEVSAKKEQARNFAQVSKVSVTPKQIRSLPSTGGTPDIAQYLPVLAGVVSTGDQGGQIYIRGGSPVQNKILLDGMTIYNPFHSVGLFSVFETETLRSVDVLTGGFNAEYGGRISAVVDLKTREGNKKRLSGLVNASPFQVKTLLEGPIVPLKSDNGNSISFMLTGKQSILPQTSKSLYDYVKRDSVGLPFDYSDYYGKVSFVAGNGSKMNVFGFNFKDGVSYTNVADLNWNTRGYGANFTLIPVGMKMIVGGNLAFSQYDISLQERDPSPRTSAVSSFNAGLDFTFLSDDSEFKYGVDLSGFSTDLAFNSPLGFTYKQNENTTELAGYARYRKVIRKRLIVEPSVRIHAYTALGETSFEPRLAAKLNITDNIRFKFSGGVFSQNLISTVSEKDVVNLFVGFLSGPEERFFKPGTTEEVTSRLQKAVHAIGGFEIDVNKNLELNIEAYVKDYKQLIDVNRLKSKFTDPNYVAETGEAYGLDITAKYEKSNFYLWSTFSHAYVNRFDGIQTYPTNFDRRNNVNILATYTFGTKKSWEAAVRWNYGSGFPFTLTQGFFTNFNFKDGIGTDILTGNPDLGVIYSNQRNSGRLPDYHRLDISLKKTVSFSKYVKMEVVASATNAYDRRNIFYFDRIRFSRVDQLPILPSLAATVHF